MNPGALRHRIKLERPVTTRSATGAEKVGFVPAFEVDASVEPLTGREALAAGQVTASMDTRITLRWSPQVDEVTSKWRIQFAGVIYNITTVAHKRLEKREVEILASSGVNRA